MGAVKARVAVCIATYARPDGLARLLDGLAALHTDACVRVVVVDNDATGPSRDACEARASAFRLGLRYEVEPRRGITYARNRSVAAAGSDVDFIAMLDDDEVPEAGWLQALLKAQAKYDADVVAGPVIPYFPSMPPEWVQEGRFFDRPRYQTGHELPHAHTHNVLVRRTVFEKTGRFDDRFALTGGEDLQFFRRVKADGARIVFANDAAVEEWIPESRANMGWLLRRAYRSGATLGQVDRDRPDALIARPMRVVRGLGRLTQGVLLTLVALVAWRDRQVRLVRALQLIYRGVGMVAGVLGGRYEEYRVTHKV
ncbi:MAG TPA: glycosyltransferase [Gemmatimonadaceae bacterium]|nr:glycosyltransferase [Gemmatimonadaceae bacterium]